MGSSIVQAGGFRTTRWSLVQAAALRREESSPDSSRALAELCEAYWQPIYAYVRRRGHPREDARDLTQAFFARLLEKNVFRTADPELGRFRAYMLGALKHFLSGERERARAQKRGGGLAPLSLDFDRADERLGNEPADYRTPESAFERDWALAVLDRALERLGEQWRARGRGQLFDALREFLLGEGAEGGYREVALQLGMTEGAVKVSAHRLRRSFRTALREEIAETVLGGKDDIEAELRRLLAALSAR